jgi:hypothetical protein
MSTQYHGAAPVRRADHLLELLVPLHLLNSYLKRPRFVNKVAAQSPDCRTNGDHICQLEVQDRLFLAEGWPVIRSVRLRVVCSVYPLQQNSVLP